jgi:hypothetical protein
MASINNSRGRKSRSSVLSPSTQKVEEPFKHTEIIQTTNESSLAEMLKSYGYLWNRAIYIGEGDNAVLLYVKASILGYKVYIEIDDYNKIKPNTKDLSITQLMRLKKEVVSNKDYLDECSTYEVNGTAYECPGGFCTIRRDFETLEVTEEDFYITTERQDSIGFEKDPTQGKPIVKLSEIKENNPLVITNIVKASKRLAAKALKEFHVRVAKITVLADELKDVVESLSDKMHETHLQVSKNVMMADSNASDLMIPPEEHEYIDYFAQTKHLEVTHSTKRRFFKEMAYLDVLETQLSTLMDDMEYMKNKLDEDYF